MSNRCATAETGERAERPRLLLVALVVIACTGTATTAEAQQEEERPPGKADATARVVAGALTGFVAHELGHLAFDFAFDAEPSVQRVEFHGIPFFALTHDANLSPRQEFAVSSAGFWVQHATNEWLLSKRPQLRRERAPFLKGLFVFNVGASFAYSAAAFARTGPLERDTRGMASSLESDERWMGALVLAPAVLDTWRYFDPDARLPVWLSRVTKAGAVLLILR